ncbi:DUF7007 domain-containing protein [Deinococcus sonorensis]|uniref:DUF7007 domain-containing protein n=1 Tax=Deinococcus sonorensis TaxID=309891 RepID=A0ABV8YBH9_9DEIO
MTLPDFDLPLPSSWGRLLMTEPVVPGIVYLCCADHGGYLLSAEANDRIPCPLRRADRLYEEDVDAAIVAYHLLPLSAAQRALARAVLRANFGEVSG